MPVGEDRRPRALARVNVLARARVTLRTKSDDGEMKAGGGGNTKLIKVDKAAGF